MRVMFQLSLSSLLSYSIASLCKAFLVYLEQGNIYSCDQIMNFLFLSHFCNHHSTTKLCSLTLISVSLIRLHFLIHTVVFFFFLELFMSF